jgi:hypothetical protein
MWKLASNWSIRIRKLPDPFRSKLGGGSYMFMLVSGLDYA